MAINRDNPKQHPRAREEAVTRARNKRVRDLAIADDHSRSHTATGVLRRMEPLTADASLPRRLMHFGVKRS